VKPGQLGLRLTQEKSSLSLAEESLADSLASAASSQHSLVGTETAEQGDDSTAAAYPRQQLRRQFSARSVCSLLPSHCSDSFSSIPPSLPSKEKLYDRLLLQELQWLGVRTRFPPLLPPPLPPLLPSMRSVTKISTRKGIDIHRPIGYGIN
jgi:hypothetical protein